MKNPKSEFLAIILVLLALGAVAFAVAFTPSTVRPANATPAGQAESLPSAPLVPSPSPSSSPSVTPVVTPSPSPSVIAGPLSGYVIGIDPGHQAAPNPDKEPISPDSSKLKAKVSKGAHGSFTKLREYELNLSVALKLRDKLESLGAVVIMTRETNDVDISNSQRARIMNEAGVDCWLRVHANNSTSSKTHGMYMLAPAKGCLDTSGDSAYTASLRLAKALLTSVLSSTGAHSRGISKRSDQTGFNWSKVPVCTIEMGFMTSKKEDMLLASEDYQQKIAAGLAQGFVDYFSK